MEGDLIQGFKNTCGDWAKLTPRSYVIVLFLICRYPNWDQHYRKSTLDEDELDPEEVSNASAAGRAHIRPQSWIDVSKERFSHQFDSKNMEAIFTTNTTLKNFAQTIETTLGGSSGDAKGIRNRMFLARLYLALYMPDINVNCIRELAKDCSVTLNIQTKKVLMNYLKTHKNIDMEAVVTLLRASNH